MVARRSALESIGLLDKGCWMYMEDLDRFYPLQQAGWLTWCEPFVLALHVKRGTTGGVCSPRLVSEFHHGMIRFYRTALRPAPPPRDQLARLRGDRRASGGRAVPVGYHAAGAAAMEPAEASGRAASAARSRSVGPANRLGPTPRMTRLRDRGYPAAMALGEAGW
jgi:hypothetical protein